MRFAEKVRECLMTQLTLAHKYLGQLYTFSKRIIRLSFIAISPSSFKSPQLFRVYNLGPNEIRLCI